MCLSMEGGSVSCVGDAVVPGRQWEGLGAGKPMLWGGMESRGLLLWEGCQGEGHPCHQDNK